MRSIVLHPVALACPFFLKLKSLDVGCWARPRNITSDVSCATVSMDTNENLIDRISAQAQCASFRAVGSGSPSGPRSSAHGVIVSCGDR